MAYKYITSFDSPNFTRAADAVRYYGMPRVIEGITIHHWGDPANNPTFQGIVNYLIRSGGNTSAHFVATGTDRQVACIVAPGDIAWHSGSAWGNARTIGIELDPRARDEDYDVAAELVADIRSAYGDVPIYWHSYFVATACPGRWNAERLDKLSYTKYSHATDWGKGGNKVTTPLPTPTPAPAPTPAPVLLTRTDTFTPAKSFKVTGATTLVNIPDGTRYGTGKTYQIGEVVDNVVEKFTYSNGTSFYRAQYARDTAKKMYGFPAGKLTEVVKETPPPVVTDPSPTTKDPVTGQPLPDTGLPTGEKQDYAEENNNLLKQILALLKSLVDKINGVFK